MRHVNESPWFTCSVSIVKSYLHLELINCRLIRTYLTKWQHFRLHLTFQMKFWYTVLTVFSPWHLHLVFALMERQGLKLTASGPLLFYFISDGIMPNTWNLTQIISNFCSLKISRWNFIPFSTFFWSQHF